ncbi:hypothetical protein [Promicromonospora kroppenstedtii]|uniref:hypothetical protein n=1 Tax=Promicromonospora kroppenstedtii TaxID=440482 RepID=UPI0004B5F0FF|nr:hypothetical protein [Promicromonospora kroppenstedtii]
MKDIPRVLVEMVENLEFSAALPEVAATKTFEEERLAGRASAGESSSERSAPRDGGSKPGIEGDE